MSEVSRHAMSRFLHYVECMGPREWVWVLVAVAIFGLFSMRGFGSRSQY